MPIPAMTAAAQANNCAYTVFSQSILVESVAQANGGYFDGRAGVCFGLAITWLESRMRGEDDEDYVLNTFTFMESNHYARSHLMWKNQRSDMWEKLASLKPAGGVKTFILSQEAHTEEVGKLVRWIRNSSGERFFLLSTHNHALAAYKSPNGRLEFFDPNAGIVSSGDVDQLITCLDTYLDTQRIRESYGVVNVNRITFEVQKFKKA